MTKSKTRSTSALRRQDPQELDLPVGIEQIGSGIGFTYNLPVVTVSSKASICTSVARTCYGRALQQLGLGLGAARFEYEGAARLEIEATRFQTGAAARFEVKFNEQILEGDV